MIHLTSVVILATLIPGVILAVKKSKEKKDLYIRDRKGRFMDSQVKMIVPDYKNSFYGKPINYKFSK